MLTSPVRKSAKSLNNTIWIALLVVIGVWIINTFLCPVQCATSFGTDKGGWVGVV